MVVSLGDYRRKILGSAGKLPSDYFTLGTIDLVPFTPQSRLDGFLT